MTVTPCAKEDERKARLPAAALHAFPRGGLAGQGYGGRERKAQREKGRRKNRPKIEREQKSGGVTWKRFFL